MIKRLVMEDIFCTIKSVAKKHSKTDRICSIKSHGFVAVFLFALAVPFAMAAVTRTNNLKRWPHA